MMKTQRVFQPGTTTIASVARILALALATLVALGALGCPSTPTPDGTAQEPTSKDGGPTTELAVDKGPSKGTFSAITYNVHGLPSGITKDDTNGRLEAIGPLLKPYQILGLQEVFTDDGYDKLKAPWDFTTHTRYEDKKENRFYGTGLLALSTYKLIDEKRLQYKDCFGTVNNASDCLASKGLQMVRLALAPGIELDVYNSHLEAGSGDKDKEARANHVKEIIDAMAKWSKDRPLLFLGDTNLKQERESDKIALADWLKTAKLTDGCEAVDCPKKGRIDRIFFRSSANLTLKALSWKIPDNFKDKEGTPLSDHDPIVVEFSWESKP